eukprot:g13569.t1 g13569   contig82:25312-26763(+)
MNQPIHSLTTLRLALSIIFLLSQNRYHDAHSDDGGSSSSINLHVGFANALSTTSLLYRISSAQNGRRMPSPTFGIASRRIDALNHSPLSLFAADSDINGDAPTVETSIDNELSIGNAADGTTMDETITTKFNPSEELFDKVVNARYACTRFQRYQELNATTTPQQSPYLPKASLSNPATLQQALASLQLSTRSPTGFNSQPYKLIMVHTPYQKQLLSQYCLGRNGDRVRDSDCTVVFLSDGEVGRDGGRFVEFLRRNMDSDCDGSDAATANEGDATTTERTNKTSRTRRPLSSNALLKLRLLILLFSSGYPFPQFLSKPLSFLVRLGVSILSMFMRILYSLKKTSASTNRLSKWISSILPTNIQLLPTLSSSETWSQKNTMLVAMTYMLACTSRGLATCPMEGFDANGVRKVLGIPGGKRYGIPLIVSTGLPYRYDNGTNSEEDVDDVGLSHGGENDMSPRYPLEEVVFGNAFGESFSLALSR